MRRCHGGDGNSMQDSGTPSDQIMPMAYMTKQTTFVVCQNLLLESVQLTDTTVGKTKLKMFFPHSFL